MKKKTFITYPAVTGKFADQDELARNFFARVREAIVESENLGDWFAMRYEGVGGGYPCEFEEESLMTHVPSEVVFILKPENSEAGLRQLIIENCNWNARDVDSFAAEYEEANETSLWDIEVTYLFEDEKEAYDFADEYLRDEKRKALYCLEK